MNELYQLQVHLNVTLTKLRLHLKYKGGSESSLYLDSAIGKIQSAIIDLDEALKLHLPPDQRG